MERNLNSSLWNYLQMLREMSEKYSHDEEPLLNRFDRRSEQSGSEVRSVLDRLSGPATVSLTLPTFQSYLPRLSESLVEHLVSLIFGNDENQVILEPDSYLNEFKKMKSCKVYSIIFLTPCPNVAVSYCIEVRQRYMANRSRHCLRLHVAQ